MAGNGVVSVQVNKTYVEGINSKGELFAISAENARLSEAVKVKVALGPGQELKDCTDPNGQSKGCYFRILMKNGVTTLLFHDERSVKDLELAVRTAMPNVAKADLSASRSVGVRAGDVVDHIHKDKVESYLMTILGNRADVVGGGALEVWKKRIEDQLPAVKGIPQVLVMLLMQALPPEQRTIELTYSRHALCGNTFVTDQRPKSIMGTATCLTLRRAIVTTSS